MRRPCREGASGAPEPVGPRALLSPPPQVPGGSLRPGLRLDQHPRFPVSTSWASNLHGRPDPSSSRLGTISSDTPAPGHQISSRNHSQGSDQWGSEEREQPAPSFQSPSTVTPRLGIVWDPRPPAPDPLLGSTPKSSTGWRGIHWLPSEGSSRGIHSQVSRDRPPGSQIEMPPPRRSKAPGDPPGPHLFPGQLCQLFSRGLSRAETCRPSPAAASPAPSQAGDRGRMACPHLPPPPLNLP